MNSYHTGCGYSPLLILTFFPLTQGWVGITFYFFVIYICLPSSFNNVSPEVKMFNACYQQINSEFITRRPYHGTKWHNKQAWDAQIQTHPCEGLQCFKNIWNVNRFGQQSIHLFQGCKNP